MYLSLRETKVDGGKNDSAQLRCGHQFAEFNTVSAEHGHAVLACDAGGGQCSHQLHGTTIKFVVRQRSFAELVCRSLWMPCRIVCQAVACREVDRAFCSQMTGT